MKRLGIGALLALAFVGCVDNPDVDTPTTPTLPAVSEVEAPATLYTTFEAVESRTTVVDDKYVRWSDGDEISYFPRVDYNVHYRLQSASMTEYGYSIFERLSDATANGNTLKYAYAVYPYAEDTEILSEGKISIQLPETQYYAKDSFGKGSAPMVAVTSGNEGSSLQFKNVAGFLKLELFGSGVVVKRIELGGNNNEKLAGTATVTAEYGSVPKIEMTASASEMVVLDCGEGVRLTEATTAFWFALPEVELTEGFTVAIYDASGVSYVKSTTKSYTIERNTVQPMVALDVLSDVNIDISEENGYVRFYLTERVGGLRAISGASEHNWEECTVNVNGSNYSVEFDDFDNPYVRVKYNEAGTYKAVLLPKGSDRWYSKNPYDGAHIPCSQFDNRAISTIRSFPMYATYTKGNGRNLVFDYGFSFLRVRLRGDATIRSVRAEYENRYDLSGIVNSVPDNGEYKVNKGMNFVALNTTNNGSNAPLNGSYRDFYLMIAPGDYGNGLRLTVSDTNYKAVFFNLSGLKLKAGDIHTIESSYTPEDDMLFYEGFDNCVWGGDIMRGTQGAGFAPNETEVKYNTELDRTGYEEALSTVAYNVAGTGFVQSNTWDDVSNLTVGASHQATDSYIASRYFADTRHIFRTQERPGYLSIGAATTSRGLYRSCTFRNVKGIGTCKMTISFAVQANFNGLLNMDVMSGGRIVSASLDGNPLTMTSDNLLYSSITSTLVIDNSLLKIPTSNISKREWQTLELEIADMANGSYIQFADSKLTSGKHGVYLNSIELRQVDEWKRDGNTLRVLLWNIQNGMWADQHNNYDNFVKWVKKWDPDVCVWCESETIYKDKTSTSTSNKYLPDNWDKVASRYGHGYVSVGGNRDNYPQTITSKYPITTHQKITDSNVKNNPISHGAGHFAITVNGKTVNIVSLHMWPQAYGFGVSTADRDASIANEEGHKYRIFEMQYIADQTVKNSKYANEKYWLLGGDTNSRSRLDNWFYKYDENAYILQTHDILLNQTDMKDVIGHRYPGYFCSSTMGSSRIDIMYASPAMYALLVNSTTLIDEWLSDTKKSEYVTSFYDRSDHRPILMDFDMSK